MSRRESHPERGGMTAVVLACCGVGAMTIAAALTLGPRPASTASASPNIPDFATEEYGKRLIGQTSELLGPDVSDAGKHYSGSRLACRSCHLGTGTEAGSLTLLQATQHFPRVSP